MMLDVTGTVINANTDQTVLIAEKKVNLFYSDFMHMAVCSLYMTVLLKFDLKNSNINFIKLY